VTDDTADSRETVELRVEPAELYQWMRAAHELDITLNEFVERALVARLTELDVIAPEGTDPLDK
jgi:predicted HicB family RNase H-like nuclease